MARRGAENRRFHLTQSLPCRVYGTHDPARCRGPILLNKGFAMRVHRFPSIVGVAALAAVLVGVLAGLQRRASGGILAPILTHCSWSLVMLTVLPMIFL